jgi:divalent metal cation (Fe/Co/Zn/Cd) transporter
MHVAVKSTADRKAMNFARNLSLGIGILMFVMKMGAYLLTGSAAILSDATESVVHVAAVIFRPLTRPASGLSHCFQNGRRG